MDIVDGVVILTAAEADKACPRNFKWAVSQVSSYGSEVCFDSKKLRPFLACTKLLEAAGVEFQVLEPETEPEAVSDVAAVVDQPGAEPVTTVIPEAVLG